MTVKVRLGHVGVVAKNPKESAEFYRDLLGMEVTMEGSFRGLGDSVFLSERPREELQTLALATNPQAAHFALKVESLGALKSILAEAQSHGVPIVMALNHKVSLSLYLLDPDGNAVEVYWSTGQKVAPQTRGRCSHSGNSGPPCCACPLGVLGCARLSAPTAARASATCARPRGRRHSQYDQPTPVGCRRLRVVHQPKWLHPLPSATRLQPT